MFNNQVMLLDCKSYVLQSMYSFWGLFPIKENFSILCTAFILAWLGSTLHLGRFLQLAWAVKRSQFMDAKAKRLVLVVCAFDVQRRVVKHQAAGVVRE